MCSCIGTKGNKSCSTSRFTNHVVVTNNLQCCSCHRQHRTSEHHLHVFSSTPWCNFRFTTSRCITRYSHVTTVVACHCTCCLDDLHLKTLKLYPSPTLSGGSVCVSIMYVALNQLHNCSKCLWCCVSWGVSLLFRFHWKWSSYVSIAQARSVVYSYTYRNS